jgi:hypothetical protein
MQHYRLEVVHCQHVFFRNIFTSKLSWCEISGSHGDKYEGESLLEYSAVKSTLYFRRLLSLL